MQRFLFLFSFLLLSRAGMSQTTDSAQVAVAPPTILPKSNYKFSIINELGYMAALTSTANMQSFFRRNDIKRETSLDPFVHFNAGGRYKRLKITVQAGYGVNYYGPNEHDALVVRRTYASYTGALLGYDVLNDRNVRLYFNLGAGSLHYDYAVFNRVNKFVTYQELTRYSQAGNIPSLKLDNSYWDVNLELSQREKRKANVASVFRLGYRRGWQPNKWQSGPFTISEFPADRISQFYFQGAFYLSTNFRPGK